MTYKWTCPYCGAHQAVTSEMISHTNALYSLGSNVHGEFGLASTAIACANRACGKVTVDVWLAPRKNRVNQFPIVDARQNSFVALRLIPESSARPQPDFIPVALREDYLEACKIRDLSPKASATLSRRCLQGMIRDFCGIKKGTLFDEISELRELVNSGMAPAGISFDSVEAIDHVRSVGNIGAHMEKNIDHIIPVDPDEAQLLIELIESLFEEWYVAREKRASRFSGIKALAESKKQMISDLRDKAIEGPKE
jgi:hypothetical protein